MFSRSPFDGDIGRVLRYDDRSGNSLARFMRQSLSAGLVANFDVVSCPDHTKVLPLAFSILALSPPSVVQLARY